MGRYGRAYKPLALTVLEEKVTGGKKSHRLAESGLWPKRGISAESRSQMCQHSEQEGLVEDEGERDREGE
jgi:hypothetical protein